MQEEYVLGSELDSAYVVRPLSLVQANGRALLILEDPGGEPLDRLLGSAFVLDLSDRKRAESALRRSEAYLAEAQRLTHTGSWAFNAATGQYTYYSDGQFRIYGLEPDPGHPPERKVIISRFHPEDRERVLGLVEQMVREKRAYTVDYRIVLPNGTVKHLHSTGHPVMDERGELREQFGTLADVTDRRRAEKRLVMETRVTRILSEATSLKEATPQILQAMCESQGWHLSALWQLAQRIFFAALDYGARHRSQPRNSWQRRGRVSLPAPELACRVESGHAVKPFTFTM
jgi:PAS domain S-box-containing protein